MFVFVCYTLLGVHFSFEITLERKRKLVALLLFSCRYIVTINVLWLILMVPWIGLKYVTVVFVTIKHCHVLALNIAIIAVVRICI